MLKLLLKEDRHEIRNEYFGRLAIVFLCFLIALVIIWGVILVAPYAQISIEKQIAKWQIEDIENSSSTKYRKEMETLSSSINQKMAYLGNPIVNPSVLIKIISDNQPNGVELNSINIDFDRSGVSRKESTDSAGNESSAQASRGIKFSQFARIELGGMAKTRSDLVLFQENLNKEKIFEKVEIPYTNFTKNEDVPFSVSLSTVELNSFLANEQQ